ncbi:MAG: hypothetical protein NUV37_02755 [Nanoarchaeota archaeon]|nr:hypothetical protein [Nanoarchaeota archaeon]
MREMNKRGQGMSITTIILIVIGIVVLVILIWGFSTGWNNLWDKVSGRTSSSNVDDVVAGCKVACDTGARDDFCNAGRTIKFGAEREVTKTVVVDENKKAELKSLWDAEVAKNPQEKDKLDAAKKAYDDYEKGILVESVSEISGTCNDFSGKVYTGLRVARCTKFQCA